MTFKELENAKFRGCDIGNNKTNFHFSGMGLSDLYGIEKYEEHLTMLDLRNNFIKDLSPIRGLTKLQYLYIGHNLINDISALNELTNLISLDLNKNMIDDYSSIGSLPSLENLFMINNAVEDLNFFKKGQQLRKLIISSPFLIDISNISVLKSLTHLSFINVNTNFEKFNNGVNCKTIEGLRSLKQLTYRLKMGSGIINAILKNKSLTEVNGKKLAKQAIKYRSNVFFMTKKKI